MDPGSIGGMILVLILLLMGSAYFSATEVALMRSNRIRLKTLAGELANCHKQRYDRLFNYLNSWQ